MIIDNSITGMRQINGKTVKFKAVYDEALDNWHVIVWDCYGYRDDRRTSDAFLEIADMVSLAVASTIG
jgi:hypothetical protein